MTGPELAAIREALAEVYRPEAIERLQAGAFG